MTERAVRSFVPPGYEPASIYGFSLPKRIVDAVMLMPERERMKVARWLDGRRPTPVGMTPVIDTAGRSFWFVEDRFFAEMRERGTNKHLVVLAP